MKRMLLAAVVAALGTGAAAPAAAQPAAPDGDARVRLPRQHLAGPRFGLTAFTGDVATLRDMVGRRPVMTQFGWQFEIQIVSLGSGHKALVENVYLVGGLGQGELNFTKALILGLRAPNGLELGAGPSVGYSREADDTTMSMVLAGGATLPLRDVYFPVNVAIAFAEGGPRITTLFGWVVG